MKWKKIDIPIYRVEVFFCIEKDGTKVNKKIKSLGFKIREKDKGDVDPISNAGCVVPVLDRDEKRSYLFWMPSYNGGSDDMDTLVHELTHVKNYVLQHIGITEGLPSRYDEIEAHLMGHLAFEFSKFIRRK